jgi:iron complex transport system permease protein
MKLSWLLLSLTLITAAALSLITPLGSLIELRQSDPALAWLVIEELRLPRTLLALGYGAVLGMTGAALQATFANPLASPDITGSSSGAALGAVAGSYWLGISGPLSLSLSPDGEVRQRPFCWRA